MYSVSRQISDVKRQMKTTTINLREPLAEQNLEVHEARNWRTATIIELSVSPISRVAKHTSEFSELTKRLNHCVNLKSEAVREKHKDGSRILNPENEGGKILTTQTNPICGSSHKYHPHLEKVTRCDMTGRRGRNCRGNEKQKKKKKRKLEDAD